MTKPSLSLGYVGFKPKVSLLNLNYIGSEIAPQPDNNPCHSKWMELENCGAESVGVLCPEGSQCRNLVAEINATCPQLSSDANLFMDNICGPDSSCMSEVMKAQRVCVSGAAGSPQEMFCDTTSACRTTIDALVEACADAPTDLSRVAAMFNDLVQGCSPGGCMQLLWETQQECVLGEDGFSVVELCDTNSSCRTKIEALTEPCANENSTLAGDAVAGYQRLLQAYCGPNAGCMQLLLATQHECVTEEGLSFEKLCDTQSSCRTTVDAILEECTGDLSHVVAGYQGMLQSCGPAGIA